MTWISLICFIVLASSAFGRYAYDSNYGAATMQQVPRLLAAMRDQAIQRQLPVAAPTYGQQQQPIFTQRISPMIQQQDMSAIQHKFHSGYGSPLMSQPLLPKALPAQNYGQGYGAMPFMPQSEQLPPPQPVLTPADILCQGQQAETVIPLENGRRFVVCLSEGKGVEQECPKGLVYHPTSQRCERKLGPLENPCALQPCLNGGQCVPSDSSYQCQCASGFDGKTCELDARVCQTQQPCGQSPDSRCQSFRLGAALQYICIFQDGLAYGLSPQQVIPSPCHDVDGPRALSVSNNGFIMCDGERMFVESCPGGTIWDDVEKACSWPDSQTDTQLDQQQGYGQSTYGQQQRMLPKSTYADQYNAGQQQKQLSSYDAQMLAPQQYQQVKAIQPYGAQMIIPQQLEQPKFIQSHHAQMIAAKQFPSYGAQLPVPQQLEQPKFTQTYGAQLSVPQQYEQPKLIQSHHAQMIAPKQFSPYGAQMNIPQQLDQPKLSQTYGAQLPVPQQLDQPRESSSYDVQRNVPQQFEQSRLVHSSRMQMIAPKQVSSYAAPMDIPQQLEQPKQVSTYGDQDLLPQQPEQIKFSQPIRQQQDNLVSMKQSSGY